MSNTKRLSSELIPVVILAFFAFLLFGKVIFSEAGLFGIDFIFQFHTWKKFIYEHTRAKSALPFWNPYLFSGTPFIANIQASMFYPLGWLYYLISPHSAYGYTTAFHCILAGIFMFIFMRRLPVSPSGAFLSAFIFSFNGYFMAHLYAGHLSFIQTYIWIPLIFCLTHNFFRTIHFKWAVSAGLILGIQILGGFPQIAFYTILAVAGFGLFNIGAYLKARQLKGSLQIGVGLVTVAAVAFGLAAVQILPTLEFAGLSTRAGGVRYSFATYDSLHPVEMVSFFAPEIFGNAVNQTYWRSSENWHFWETCGYVGIVPLCLVFVSLRSSAFRPMRAFFLALVLLALFLALGKYNPFYAIIYKLPGFNRFRVPAQILFLYVFGLSALAGIGLNQIRRNTWTIGKPLAVFLALIGCVLITIVVACHIFPYRFFFHRFKICTLHTVQHIDTAQVYNIIQGALDQAAALFFASVLLLLAFRYKFLRHSTFRVLILAVAIIDLGVFSMQFVKTYKFVCPTYKKHLIAQLNETAAQGRVVAHGIYFKPNDGLEHTFPSVMGYDPLILRRYARYIRASQDLPPTDHLVNLSQIENPNSKLLRMLNVRQVVSGKGVTTINAGFPYATMVSTMIIKPKIDVLAFMKGKDFDPQEMVVLEPEHAQPILHDNTAVGFKPSCSVLDYDNEDITIRASANRPGYLVLSEIFYPGWVATVDGVKVPILRGNYLFRTIPLDKGDHEVRLHFVSWPFRIGVLISLLTALGAIVFVSYTRH